jgi:hypothetical protein
MKTLAPAAPKLQQTLGPPKSTKASTLPTQSTGLVPAPVQGSNMIKALRNR